MKKSALDVEELARVGATVLDQAAEAVAIIGRDLKFQWVNKAFELITGYDEGEVIGEPLSMLRGDMHTEDFYDGILRTLQAEGRWSGEVWRRRSNGEAFPAMLTVTAIYDDDGAIEYFVDFFNDVTFIHGDRKRLETLVNHDALTGLPNRRLLWDRLETAVQRAERSEWQLAVVFIDIDDFKQLNDSLGHRAGDQVLRAFAKTFEGRLRRVDTLARVGGDEFVLILEYLQEPCDLEWVSELAQRGQIELDGPEAVTVCASVGCAIYPGDGRDAETLYAAADSAMYEEKKRKWRESGRGPRGEAR